MSETANDSFVRMVKRLARRGSDQIIENASIEHARVIIECLLDEALKRKEEVRIASGRLEESFYSKLTGKAKEALTAGSTVDVVVLDADREHLKENSFCRAVQGSSRGNVYFVHDEDLTPHFVVTGGRRYRVEVDDARKKAMACFNDDSNGKMLVDIHKRLVKKAKAGSEVAVS